MNPRFLEFQNMLAQRDAALVSLALLCLAGLVGWWAVRAAFGEQAQNRILTLAAIAFYVTLAMVVFSGG